MGVLFEYFRAPSDEAAIATIDRPQGPGPPKTPASQPSAARRSLFRRPKPTPAAELDEVAYETVEAKGVDPVVMISTLQSILTGVPYDTLINGPRAGHVLADRGGGERLVVSLSEEIQEALASADEQVLTRVASEWIQTDEFAIVAGWNQADVSRIVHDLAHLARRASEHKNGLYCWVCV